jgi:phosphoribosylanthranilate isomerase
VKLLAKVCGLTCAEDAEVALRAGADLLGFVVHPESPRHCPDVKSAAAVAPERGVLVMVAMAADPILRAAEASGLRRIQAHVPVARRADVLGRLAAEGYELLIPWADEPGQRDPELGLLLWEPSPRRTGLLGGSGQTHPMSFPPPRPFLLAGGLDGDVLPERLAAIPETVLPRLRGVDAASRLERIPGRKDPSKVHAFIGALRAFETARAHTA